MKRLSPALLNGAMGLWPAFNPAIYPGGQA